jgi:hypothetical protein
LRGFTGLLTGARGLSAAAALAGLTLATSANAQNYGVGNQGWDQKLYSSPQLYGPANPISGPSREYTGLPVGGWMMYASVLSGVVWDDNVYQAHEFTTEDWGARLRPSLELSYNNGIHKTTFYGLVDARMYGEDDADVVNGSTGVSHVWEVQRDLVLKGELGYSRRTDINNAGFVVTPNGPETIVDPLEYDETFGSLSFQKSFGPVFVALGGVISHTNYDDLTDSLGRFIEQDQRDQTVYTFSGRIGTWLSPVFYTFVEPSQNWRKFREDSFDSSGQRIVAGFGSDRLSLFRGEVFAGYQRQEYDAATIDAVEGEVFGGRLFWYPTRDLMFTLEADRTLGDSTLSTPGNPDGSPVEATSFVLRGDYLLTDIWSLSARAGYTFTDFKETGRQDDQWVAGTTVSYFVWRNLATTFEWQYVNLDSSVDANSFDRNVFTLGATYKY